MIESDASWRLFDTIKSIASSNGQSANAMATCVRVLSDGTRMMQLVGSSILTPLNGSMAAEISQGDMAEVRIEDGVMSLTANVSNPSVGQSEVNDAVADKATVRQLGESNARIEHLEVTALTAESATIANLQADTAKVHDLTADQLTAATAYVGALDAGNVTAAQLIADHATVGALDSTYAKVDMANVNNAWISNGTIKNGAIVSAMINDVSANKLTAGTINGSVINVTNLNADNITTGTINGQRIGEGSLSLSKLEDDVYTEAEVNNIVDGLNDRIDGAIETHTGTAVPTLNNSPASSWNTTKLKDEHVGDVYYVVNSQSQQNGYCYRFTKSGSTYSWQLIKDSDVTAALSRLTTAEGKITTFDSDISTLKTDTGTLKTKTESLETRMSDAEDDILDKVDTTTFNEVSDTVDQHSQTITQMSQTLSNKADGSTVTALTTRVSKTEQDITGVSTTIGELQTTVESKADISTVETVSNKLNTVSDTVDGHTQSITSINNTLETKANSSTVSTLTTKVNNVSDTVDGHTSQLGRIQTRVENSDPNMLLDWNAPSLTKVDAKVNRYFSNASNVEVRPTSFAISDPPMVGIENGVRFVCDGTQTAARGRALAFYNESASTALAFVDGQTYTASWWARCTDGSGETYLSYVNGGTDTTKTNGVHALTSEWQHFTDTFKPARNTSHGSRVWFFSRFAAGVSGTVELCGFKLVPGESAENVATSVTTLSNDYATFKQTVETFESTVGETYATKTELADQVSVRFKLIRNKWTDAQWATHEAVGYSTTWMNKHYHTNSNTGSDTGFDATKVKVGDYILIEGVSNDSNSQHSVMAKITSVPTEAGNGFPATTVSGVNSTQLASRVSTAETSIQQNRDAIALRATKTEAYQVAQPNLTPIFSVDFTDLYNATTNPNGYWRVDETGQNFTQLSDGWAHYEFDNTGGSDQKYNYIRPGRVPSIVAGNPYTILVEIRNNAPTGTGTHDSYVQAISNNQFYGNTTGDVIDADHTTTSTTIPLASRGESFEIRSYRLADVTHLTDESGWVFTYAVRTAVGCTNSFDIRMSLYEGIYDGPYKPYIGEKLYATNSELKVTAEGISTQVSTKVGNDEIISKINQSAETIKIQASKVQIDGAAIFTAISSDVDGAITGKGYQTSSQVESAITGKGYATTTQAQGYASTAQSNAISAAATDATTKANTAESNAKEYADAIEVGGRNIAKASDAVVTPTTYNALNIYLSEPLEAEQTYVFQLWDVDVSHSAKSTAQLGVDVYYCGGTIKMSGWHGSSYFTNGHAGHLQLILTPHSSAATDAEGGSESTKNSISDASSVAKPYINLYNSVPEASGTMNLTVGKWKLEKGNRATDWSPAPEDVAADISASVVGQGGFTILWNYASFTEANNGEAYVCALNPLTNQTSDADGWAMWNGVKRTIPHAMINPNSVVPFRIPIYVVCRLSSATATTGTLYLVWYNDRWKWSTRAPSAVGGTFTWVDSTDMVLGTFVMTSTEGAISETVVFRTPWSSKQVTTSTVTANSAQNLANTANNTANAAAPKANAVARSQRIYYRKTSSGAPAANTTWLATSGTGYGNWSLKVPPLTTGTGANVIKYPYLYTAVQTQTVAQQAAGTTCSCSAVLIDDSSTVIDGGNIITGTVSANAINAASGTFDTANIPALTADHIKANVISAVNKGTGLINANKINASGITIGYSQIENPPTIPSTVAELSDASDYAKQSALTTEINQRKAAYATSSTAAGTQAKAATCANFALYTGASVTVTFSNANTHATPTLNVNSTGAKSIRGYTGAALTTAEYKWAAGAAITFVYDGSYWRMQDGGAQQAKADAANAARTATNYITHVNNNGITIHPQSGTSNRVAINADGTEVFKGNESVASYGDTTRIGKTAAPRVVIESSSIDMYGKSDGSKLVATLYESAGYGVIETDSFIANNLIKVATGGTLTTPEIEIGTVGQTHTISGINFGFSSATTNSNGITTFNPGLGVAPTAVFVAPGKASNETEAVAKIAVPMVWSIDSATQVQVRWQRSDKDAWLASNSVGWYWLALYSE